MNDFKERKAFLEDRFGDFLMNREIKKIAKIPTDTTYCSNCPYWKTRKEYIIDVLWIYKTERKIFLYKEMLNIYKAKNIFQVLKNIYKQNKGHGIYYCKYLHYKDIYQGESLLWDQCKECGIGEDEKNL